MTLRRIAICAVACVMLAACGHYGPPVREHEEPGTATDEHPHEHKDRPVMKERRDGP